MGEMLTKVAEAIHGRAGKTRYGELVSRKLCDELAKEAVLALRDISQTVLDADTPLGPSHRYGQWAAHIDAILEEENE